MTTVRSIDYEWNERGSSPIRRQSVVKVLDGPKTAETTQPRERAHLHRSRQHVQPATYV
jgi:hypothetical protein